MIDALRHVHVAVAGTGFAGLGAAIRMKLGGIDDFIMFERANEIGGTWRDNSYPNCACDVPSNLYSLSFAPNPSWSRAFSPQAEILSYLKDCAQRHALYPHIRFDCSVLEAHWEEQSQHWRIETSQGTFTADVFVSAVGWMSTPSTPTFPGLETFEGTTFHSAAWNHDYDLEGKRVAVIGTGASSIQIVPAIAPKVGALHVFQRTPPWILPRLDHRRSGIAKRVFRALPFLQRAVRSFIYWSRELLALGFFSSPRMLKLIQGLGLFHLWRQVKDPALRATLTPKYVLGCKRVLVSDDYYPALTRENVHVVTDAIAEVRPRSIVTANGTEHEVDAVVFGTGFLVTDIPIAKHIHGTSGQSLEDTWQGSMKAHVGTTVSGFPNFFMFLGPNTAVGHTSVLVMIECQIEHFINALRYMKKSAVASVEPRAEAQAAYVAKIDEQMRGSVWSTGGCSSWYLDKTGRVSTAWPGFTFAFKRRVTRFDPSEYLTVPPIDARPTRGDHDAAVTPENPTTLQSSIARTSHASRVLTMLTLALTTIFFLAGWLR